MRHMLAAATAALLVLVLGTTGVLVVENRTSAVAASLGYDGATVRIHVMDLGDRDAAADAILDFADQTASAVAYTPASDAGLVTIYDPHGLFRGPEGPLYAPLAAAGDAPAALVADRLGADVDDLRAVLSPATDVVGSVSPGVGFAASRPMVIRNPAAGPLGGGLYVLAGDGVTDAQQLVDTLLADGAWVSEATVVGSVPLAPFDGPRAAILAALLAVFVVTSALLIVLDVARGADRARVAALLGAGRRDLRRVLGSIWPRLAVGCGAGLLAVLAVTAVAAWRLTTAGWVLAVTITGATATAVLWCLVVAGGAVRWQAWRCSRALPR